MTMSERRIYLDYAVTSFPKPPEVGAAMVRYINEIGVAAGRGTTRRGREVQRVIDRCRQRIAALVGTTDSSRVIFTSNGTDSLNLAIHGLLRAGDQVVTTVWEHNSVLRPLHSLQQSQGVQTTFVPPDTAGTVDLNAYAEALRNSPRLVIITHASNVTGVIQPVEEMARLAHAAGAFVLLDAAQTLGAIPVTLKETGADLIAAPGHKGLQGPLGTGVLVIAPGIEKELQPVRQGGTGTSSESPEQPLQLPERYEPGNLNVPGLFGLEAALDRNQGTLNSLSISNGSELTRQFIAGLESLPGVHVHLSAPEIQRVPVISVSFDRVTPQVMATLLDEHYDIEARAGFHCAPKAHDALGTLEQGGTIRFSLGPAITADEIDLTLAALAEITAAL
ncbi:aminotransferase class V-fold PLP-dependent enzyme [Planctomicrobium sp. SH527]|uniref:aminotransferase class V-fold PLP-dependent enzyme n=1 Tax=Planctomicrobium sp. SH527 TaxID=3448123 RepID=UPI003F5C6E2A